MTAEAEKQIAMKVAKTALVVNSLLTLAKLVMGLVAQSGALVSDAVHSASDVGATLVVMLGFQFSKKAPDDRHPYGHEKIESMVGIALALVLMVTALAIGWQGIIGVQSALAGGVVIIPGALALVGSVLSIVVQETMYRYTIGKAKQLQSSSLEASAWHHRSDAFSSIGSFLGIAGARLGWPILDPLTALVISGFIIKVGIDILRKAVAQTIDEAVDESTEEEIRRMVLSHKDVKDISEMRTRQSASKMFVDLSIACDAELSLEEAHAIAEEVHDNLEASFSSLIHCTVHVDPYHNRAIAEN